MGATGYVLKVPQEVLDKLELADTKIKNIGESSEKAEARFKAAFRNMANSVDPLIKQLDALKGLKNLQIDSTLKRSSTEAEKTATNIAQVATQLNRVAESPVDTVNKKLESMRALMDETRAASEKLASSTSKGVISRDTLSAGSTANSLIPEIQGQIKVLELERAELQQNSRYWKQYIDNLNGSSLAAQKQKAEMDKLNDSFRSGSSAMQKQAQAEDKLWRETQKAAQAAEKAAQAEQKKNAARSNAANTAAVRAEEQYARALNRSEVTIVQRARKIEALANAQRALNQTGRDYSAQLSKITAETQRLQKANDEAAKSMTKLKSNQSSVLNTTDQLSRKFALLFSVAAIQGYVEKLVAVRGEFELQQRALQAILQNKDEANALWEKTVALAIKSPFQVKELVTYTKQLAAYRIESDKLYDTTKMLADVSAGLGVDMGRLILAYGQVKAANYLRASEVRQFTEAGVNILGELADIYTELEGRMVSVGEVQSRITKRMVAFGDVEQVFKRITSAGGIFYNMQEIQAETLAGMISNLKDNFDVMFNDIGKANDGVLKGFINIINDIVANWRILAVALNAAMIGLAAYTAKTTIAIIANNGFTASTIEAAVAQGGLTKALIVTGNALFKFGKFLLSNPYILVATAVAAVVFYLKELAYQADETRATYDTLNNQLDTQKEKLESLVTSIENQVSAQEKAEAALANFKKGTKEYKDAEAKANEERDKTQKLLNTLKMQYPEVYAKVMQNKDGIKSLASEQKKYNDELERTQVLNKLMQAGVPLFGASFKEQAESYTNSLDRQNKAVDNVTQSYNALLSQVQFYLKTQKRIPEQLKENINAVINGNEPIQKRARLLANYTENLKLYSQTENRQLTNLAKDAKKSIAELERATANRKVQLESMNEAYVSLRDNALKEAGITLEEFKKLSKQEQDDLGKRMADFIKSSAGAESDFSRFFLKNRIKQDFAISISYDKPQVEKAMTQLQSDLAKYVDEYNKQEDVSKRKVLKLPAVTSETDVEEYRDKIFASGKALLEAAKENSNSVSNLAVNIDKDQKEAIRIATEAGEAQQKIAKAFGYTDKKGEKAGETAYERQIKSQLDLLKKMQSQYEKLRQTMGDKEATETITKEFGKAYEDLFNKPLTLKFDKASIANEMESIAATIGGKSAEALRRSWYSTIGQLRSEITVTATIENTEAFEREMDSMFNNYQLYIELEAKGLPKDVISNLFGIDVTTLDDLKKEVEARYPDISALGEKELDSYYKIQKKITDFEKKELQKRSNLLAEYLEQSVDKVKQVQNSGALEISFATDFFKKGKLDAEQYATIIKNVTDKVNKEVSRLNMEKFKETPEYIQAIGDLSAFSATQLKKMIARMQEFINNSAGNLNASDLKVYTDLIDKRKERLKNVKSPINKNAFAEYRQLIKLQKEYNTEEENYNRLLEIQKQREEELKKAKQELQELQDASKTSVSTVNADDLAKAGETVQTATSNLSSANNQLNISQGKLGNISGKMGQIQGGLSSAMSMVDKIVTGIYQSINATIDLMNQFKDLAESQGVDVNKGGWREVAQAGELLGNVNEKVMSSWNNFKSGNIAGAVADAVGSITTIFTTFNKQHDARREQKIQEEIKQVEKLQKAYQRLGKAISDAYTIDTLNVSNENAQRNIKEQIQSYQDMIAAEEDKKDTDWDRIDEWKEAITDLQEQAAELQNQKIADLGGFGSGSAMASAANEFASAWLDAYRETGDGLTALEDKWDEYINNVLVKQLALRGITTFLEPIMKKLDKMIGDDSYLSDSELEELQKDIDKVMPALNDYWKKLAESFKVPVGEDTSDNASTLNKGIQGVTEETANVIEAYLNSMRYFVADSNMVLNNFYLAFMSTDPMLNPMFSELSNQTKLLRSIDDRLSSVITYSGDHPNGGASIKVLT